MRLLLHLLLVAACWLGIVLLVPSPPPFATNHKTAKRTDFQSPPQFVTLR